MPEHERRQLIRQMLVEARQASRRSQADDATPETSLGSETLRLARLATAMHLNAAAHEQRVDRDQPVEAAP